VWVLVCVFACLRSRTNQPFRLLGIRTPIESRPASHTCIWKKNLCHWLPDGDTSNHFRDVPVCEEKREREGEQSSAVHIQGWGKLSTSVFLRRIGACRESERRESEGGPRGGAGGSNQISVVSKIHPLCEVTKTNRSRGDGSLLETPTAHVVTT
jgi:hypothetical protein